MGTDIHNGVERTDGELHVMQILDGLPISQNNPIPSDGDSVYTKDVWEEESTSLNFSGSVMDLFDNLHSQIVNSDSENPKTLLVHFNRTIVSNTIGIGNTGGGDFSNVKIEIINSGGTATTVIDESGSSTKYTTRTFQLPVTAGFNALRITFHTTDTISLSNCVILKTRSTVSRVQAVKPDGTVVDLNATAGGNQKFSLEEFDESFDTTPLPVLSKEFLLQVKLGNVAGHRLIHKFGHNNSVTTSPAPIAGGGVYQTPSANATLELLSSDANDSSAGTGARKIVVEGRVLTNGKFIWQSEEVVTNGTTPVVLSNQFIRVFRAWISESGTYADTGTVSGAGTITVRGSGGGITWLEIGEFATGNSSGQSQVALYTTPTDTKSILFAPIFTIDSTKVGNILFFQRPNADDVTTPFTGARRLVQEWKGISQPDGTSFMVPVAFFSGATDMGFMGSVSVGTGDISSEFWLLEIDV